MQNDNEIQGWVALVIDDEPDNLEIVRKIFAFHGVKVYTAPDGVEGLKILQNLRPTFVLVDLSMPNMDGWELLKAIRSDPAISNLPVIALTAHAMTGDRKRALEAGFNGYICKPFRLATLLSDIKSCLT